MRARVNGKLLSRDYQEGQLVKEGDLLFTLETAPFQVAVEKVEAELQRATAELDDAERQWKRIDSLFDKGAVSQRERDQGLANLALAKANQRAAEASVSDAQIQLGYTKVRSPITGIAGREALSVGNVVQENDVLANVVQLDPLYVVFSIPQNDFAAGYLLEEVPLESSDTADLPMATVQMNDGQSHPEQGVIDFVSRAVSTESGTLEARARIPNPDATLLPGQFVRVVLPEIRLRDVVSIPERALVQSGNDSLVYVVDDNQRVQTRRVMLGPDSGDQVVISDGLNGGESVVVEGLTNISEGDRVDVGRYVAAGELDPGAGAGSEAESGSETNDSDESSE